MSKNGSNKFRYYDSPFTPFYSIVELYAKSIKKFFFIQIGATDGLLHDPIHKFIEKYKWQGILLEPQRKEFKKLKKNYKNHTGLIFENVAISSSNKVKKLYKPKEKFIRHDYERGLATFVPNKNAMFKFMKEEKYQVENVNCISFQNLLEKHNVNKIDLLQIDTEGYDYKIIKSINFNKIEPRIINYENINLNTKEREECIKFLKEKGYLVINYGIDTVAF